jgi:ABC-type transport system involved in cytochrome c biogenesis permease subunit
MSGVPFKFLCMGAFCYLISTAWAFASLRGDSRDRLIFARSFAILGMLFHAMLLVRLGLERGRFPVTGALESFVFLATAVTIVALALDGLRRLPIVTVGALPLALVTSILAITLACTPPATSTTTPPPGTASVWTGVHVVIALGSYGAFALAFVSGIVYLVGQRRLKDHAVSPLLGLIPSLETVGRLTVHSVAVGVVLLVAGLLVGYLHARNVYAGTSGWRVDPKIILTTLTVVAYGVVLALSGRPAFKGRRTAIYSVAGFLLVMATFWASVFWSDFHRFR